jgi:N-acetylneuraminic acid mutarotase
MVYDPYNQVMVMYGGFTEPYGVGESDDTWFYDYATNTWTEHTGIAPPARRAVMVYCNETNEIIVYGGSSHYDTWSFDCTTQTWSQVITASNPGVHYEHCMAYDPQQNAIILFGGFGADGFARDDTWKFDCVTREWTELNPTTSPSARYGFVMEYDDSIDQIILSCGNTATQGHQDDTWTYDFEANTWTEIDTTGTPGRLYWGRMAYDSINQRMVLFGGEVDDTTVDATKIYNAQNETWTNAAPDVAPAARIVTAMAYNPYYGVIITYGGIDSDWVNLGDTWAYEYSTNTWTDMSSVTDIPTPISTPTNRETTTSSTIPPPETIPLELLVIGIAVPVAIVVVVVVWKTKSK